MTKECCMKCSVQIYDDTPTIPCEHCFCHQEIICCLNGNFGEKHICLKEPNEKETIHDLLKRYGIENTALEIEILRRIEDYFEKIKKL